MTPHKHHDLIVAWAKGAQIQFKIPNAGRLIHQWHDTPSPEWLPNLEYRIKPEPKPDKKATYQVQWPDGQLSPRWHQKAMNNLQLTFDGETGKLKEAEVIDEE